MSTELIKAGSKVQAIDVSLIKTDWRARADYGNLEELAEDIKRNGQICPVMVRRSKEDGKFVIVAGLRRTRACKLLGIPVKAVIVDLKDELQILDLQLAENLARKEFDALEVGDGLRKRKEIYEKLYPTTAHGKIGKHRGKKSENNQERFTLVTAKQFGKSESWVQKMLNQADLSEEERQTVDAAESTKERNKQLQQITRTKKHTKKLEKLQQKAEERHEELAPQAEKLRKKQAPKMKVEEEDDLSDDEAPTNVVGTVFEGKWEDRLEELTQEGFQFDLILTDPPYSLERSTVSHAKRKNVNDDNVDWDTLDVGWVLSFVQLLNENGQLLAFCPMEAIGDYKEVFKEAGLKYRGALIWHKTNPGTVHRNVYLSSCEALVWATASDEYYFEPWENAGVAEVHNFREGPICAGNERLDHPAQKPLWLVEDLIRRHTAAGDYVLDPFMGVGTTLAACKRLGRHSTGIEVSKEYLRQARARLRVA